MKRGLAPLGDARPWRQRAAGSVLALDPFSGHLFCLRSQRGDYLKILYWAGSGLCLFAKRLERGRFVWPQVVDGALILTPAQLALLLEAIDCGRWRQRCRHARRRSEDGADEVVVGPLPHRP